MNFVRTIALIGVAATLCLGCSEKTKQETKEALEATGEAATAAVEDSKANAKKIGEVVEAGVEGAKEKASELRDSPPADDPADADAVPEAEEPQP